MKFWKKRIAIPAIFVMFMAFSADMFGHEGKKHPSPTPSPQAEMPAAASPETPAAPAPEAPAEVTEFPNYHPLVVHFPIVLLIFAAVFQLLAFLVYRKEMSVAAILLIAVGVISVWLASNTFHGHAGELPERIRAIFEEHELMADYTLWFSAAALAVKIVSHFLLSRTWWSEAAALALLAGAAVTVSIAGHHGAQLVHIEGVGPKGNYLEIHEHQE